MLEIKLRQINSHARYKLEQNCVIDLITGCWLWQGSKDKKGYGTVSYLNKSWLVHRLSAKLYHDKFDPRALYCHIRECPNRHCFNPLHIYAGTAQTNSTDMIAVGHNTQGKQPEEYCHQGHRMTIENSYFRKNGSKFCKICTKSRYRLNSLWRG